MIIFPKPSEETLMNFIVQNNAMENLPLQINDVFQTLQRKNINPLASGHLTALQYTFKCAQNPHWPAKNAIDYHDEFQSHKNLYWLRNIHEHVMKSISTLGPNRPDLNIPFYPLNECGQYRLLTRNILDGRNGFFRPMPRPGVIKRLLHHWYKDLAQFHLAYADKLPPSRTLAEMTKLSDAAHKFHIQLLCIHPFLDGTARVARILENALRLRWGLAWLTTPAENKQEYCLEIMTYEDGTEWQQHLLKLDAKGR